MHCPLLVRGQQYSNRENRKSDRLWYVLGDLLHFQGGVNVTYLIKTYL